MISSEERKVQKKPKDIKTNEPTKEVPKVDQTDEKPTIELELYTKPVEMQSPVVETKQRVEEQVKQKPLYSPNICIIKNIKEVCQYVAQ